MKKAEKHQIKRKEFVNEWQEIILLYQKIQKKFRLDFLFKLVIKFVKLLLRAIALSAVETFLDL